MERRTTSNQINNEQRIQRSLDEMEMLRERRSAVARAVSLKQFIKEKCNYIEWHQ